MREIVKKRENIIEDTNSLWHLFEGSIWAKDYYSDEAIVMPRLEIMEPYENKDVLYITSVSYL